MKIVCVSHNAPPLNDAEALCTIRLLSALVDCGAQVHLVTADSPASLDRGIHEELMDNRIRVTSVPKPSGRLVRVGSIVKQQFHGQSVEWVAPAIEATRRVLAQYEKPILLTRAFPLVSNLVGHHCRKDARAWVAHFSDPYPPVEWQNHWYSSLARPIHRRWARRILGEADLVTGTCPNAIRYIEEKSGFDFGHKAHVLSHLALPELRPGDFTLDRCPDEFVVAHIGNLMQRRRPDLLLQGVLLAMERHPAIRFLQYGHVDDEVLALCRSSSAFRKLDIRKVDNLSPRDAADLQRQVDVNVIVDTDLGLPYSPFILSKFPHSVCAGRPLLMLSAPDSDMARFTRCHGGGEFVPFSTPEAVCEAIFRLFTARSEEMEACPSRTYANEFSPERIVLPFMERLEQLLTA